MQIDDASKIDVFRTWFRSGKAQNVKQAPKQTDVNQLAVMPNTSIFVFVASSKPGVSTKTISWG
jgi:hypothetical protein